MDVCHRVAVESGVLPESVAGVVTRVPHAESVTPAAVRAPDELSGLDADRVPAAQARVTRPDLMPSMAACVKIMMDRRGRG